MTEVQKAIRKTSDELGLNSRDVEEAYRIYWKFFREETAKFDFHGGMTKDEYESKCHSFNIPSIGKFCCTYDRYLRLKTRSKKLGYVEDN